MFATKLNLPKVFHKLIKNARLLSAHAKPSTSDTITIHNKTFKRDDYTNITDKIISLSRRNLHIQPNHPLNLVRQRIVNYFYKRFLNSRGNPLFSVYDNLSPVVTVEQNFDSLLIPQNHPSRNKTDCYYVNRDYLLRAHTTAHQAEFIQSGLDNFLIVGDVYRRDEIDSKHYPVFHQLDAVRLRTRDQLFPNDEALTLFICDDTTCIPGGPLKQKCHTLEAFKVMEYELKSALEGLAKELFGKDIKYRWVETTFPFTQPSWELEIYYNTEWLEILGCGIMVQSILSDVGVHNRIGWAFGLGLERIAMCLYKIPDIRLFWSTDSGFLNQFKFKDLNTPVTYKAVSQYPQCNHDISFWLPDEENGQFSSNDFYDLVRSIGGDIVEQVILIDNFTHPKSESKNKIIKSLTAAIYINMTKNITKLDNKQLLEELKSAIHEDKLYWIRNDAKLKACITSKTYDEFRETVAAAHLMPLSKQDWKKRLNTWNTVAKDKDNE
ncbi:hypothetical protein FQR65_LT09150 [Abscondita terminalis]|nr:hypothetical protein FQR65_LT09150 [Abscondita terminalis]